MFGFGNETILKGNPPKYEKEKKTFKIWYRDFCQDYHYDRAAQLEEIMDENGDSYVKPHFKLFLYNCYRGIKSWGPIFSLRMKTQRLFTGISDDMLWNLDYPIAKYCLKLVKAYKKMERHGYPGCFSEYSENEWKSREEYDEAIANGRMIGGGPEAWEKILDTIIMAFEFITFEYKDKPEKWYLKYFGMNPYEKGYECNAHARYEYKELNNKPNYGCTMSSNKPDLEKVEWCTYEKSYHNLELVMYAEHCVDYGCQLFGDFFRCLWD